MDKYPISASSLEKFYYVDGHQLERQYKDHLSDYLDWAISEIGLHAENWLVFPENVGPRQSIDETSLSDGELYTIVTNKDAHGRKGALVTSSVCHGICQLIEDGDKNEVFMLFKKYRDYYNRIRAYKTTKTGR